MSYNITYIDFGSGTPHKTIKYHVTFPDLSRLLVAARQRNLSDLLLLFSTRFRV